MPLMGGFEVIQSLAGDRLPVIVIVTAFDEHAIQGFEAGAIDYLLKPVSEARLQKAVKRAWELKHKPLDIANHLARIAAAATPSGSVGARKIVGRAGSDYVLLDAGEDFWRFKPKANWFGSSPQSSVCWRHRTCGVLKIA